MLISHRLVTIKVIKGDYIMDYKILWITKSKGIQIAQS